MSDRVYMDESLNKNADEHLEVVFKEVYDWNLSDHSAIGLLLDPYTSAIFGAAAVPFNGALEDLAHAVKWATQFGELRIIPITTDDRKSITAQVGDKVVNYGAKIGDDREDQFRAYGDSVLQVVILAGVQVLREYAYDLLNTKAGDTAH
jgi:hypothetical protein